MVLVQYLFGPFYVVVVLCALIPGKCKDPVYVVADNRCLCRHWGHELELLELMTYLGCCLLGKPLSLDLLLKLLELALGLILLAHLLLDRPYLFIQIVILLILLHLLLDTLFYPLFHLGNLGLGGHKGVELLKTLNRVKCLKHSLLVCHL